MTKLYKPEKISLLNHPTIKEGWIRDEIANDPLLLNLGDIVLKDKERTQPKAGRLDLLLQDSSNRRYEVEIQLGDTDESHIIRTIEYWDIERKRYPQYDHCAVLIAENITSRFLNVISLFNSHIPLIAIQMGAYKFNEDSIALIFTTVLDEMSLGLVDEDEEEVVTDRNYWIKHGTDKTVEMADEILEIIKKFAPKFNLNYHKFFIGLADDGQPNNFVSFNPRKTALNINIRLPFSNEIQEKIEKAGLDDMGYDKRWNAYRLRLVKGDITKHNELLAELLRKSCEIYK